MLLLPKILFISLDQEGKLSWIQDRICIMERLLDKLHEPSMEQRPGTQDSFFPAECPNH